LLYVLKIYYINVASLKKIIYNVQGSFVYTIVMVKRHGEPHSQSGFPYYSVHLIEENVPAIRM